MVETDLLTVMKMNKPRISIIIATLDEPTHLWFTISGLKEELRFFNDTAEIIIADNSDNGHTTFSRYVDQGIRVINVSAKSTAGVRNIPAKQATGDILCFVDTHVVFGRNTFTRALKIFDAYPAVGMLHGHTLLWDHKECFYGYDLTLDTNFWGTNSNKDRSVDGQPYFIPASGHGLVFIRRSVFEEIGGYLDEQTGWGGEEIPVDLLIWMYDYHVLLDPTIRHYHLPGDFRRPYHRNNKELIRNMLCASYILGGKEWMNKTKSYYLTVDRDYVNLIAPDIPVVCNDRRNKVIKEAKFSLEELFKLWDKMGVIYKK